MWGVNCEIQFSSSSSSVSLLGWYANKTSFSFSSPPMKGLMLLDRSKWGSKEEEMEFPSCLEIRQLLKREKGKKPILGQKGFSYYRENMESLVKFCIGLPPRHLSSETLLNRHFFPFSYMMTPSFNLSFFPLLHGEWVKNNSLWLTQAHLSYPIIWFFYFPTIPICICGSRLCVGVCLKERGGVAKRTEFEFIFPEPPRFFANSAAHMREKGNM